VVELGPDVEVGRVVEDRRALGAVDEGQGPSGGGLERREGSAGVGETILGAVGEETLEDRIDGGGRQAVAIDRGVAAAAGRVAGPGVASVEEVKDDAAERPEIAARGQGFAREALRSGEGQDPGGRPPA